MCNDRKEGVNDFMISEENKKVKKVSPREKVCELNNKNRGMGESDW